VELGTNGHAEQSSCISRGLNGAVTINLIFRPRRYQLNATSYRHARTDAFNLWSDYTAEMAA
jgi:putative transposase